MAEVIFQDKRSQENVEIEAIIYKVEESSQYPQGLRYSFQAHSNGKTVLRYDNYNKHSDSKHHKHIGENKTDAIEKTPENKKDLIKLYQKFLQEVEKHK